MSLKSFAVRTDTPGDVSVNINSGQSVAATQSGSWTAQITDGTDVATVVADGDTATAQKGLVGVVAKANTSDPTPSNGTLTLLSVDPTNGALRTKILGSVDTELPAAAALANGAANPTTPTVGAANLLYNGTTWDRIPGDTTNGVDVDVTRLPALVAGSANIGKIVLTDGTDDAEIATTNAAAAGKGLSVLPAQAQNSPTALTDGRAAFLSMDLSGNLRVASSVPTPSNSSMEYLSSSALAANSAATVNGANITTAVVKKLHAISYATTGQARLEFYRFVNGVVDTNPFLVVQTSTARPSDYVRMPHQDFVTITGTAGVDNFRVVVNNTEPSGGQSINVDIVLYEAES